MLSPPKKLTNMDWAGDERKVKNTAISPSTDYKAQRKTIISPAKIWPIWIKAEEMKGELKGQEVGPRGVSGQPWYWAKGQNDVTTPWDEAGFVTSGNINIVIIIIRKQKHDIRKSPFLKAKVLFWDQTELTSTTSFFSTTCGGLRKILVCRKFTL